MTAAHHAGDTGHNALGVPDFGQYRLGIELGHGASGRVFECTTPGTDETYAVKVVDLRHLRLSGGTDRVLKNLRREVKILKSLPAHANIVRMIDSLEQDAFFYLVLELVSGGDLFSLLMHRSGPRPRLHEKEAAYVFGQLLDGLAFLHGHRVVHRDLKLENILIANEWREGIYEYYRVKITDFGLSKAMGSGLVEAHSVVGTRRYAAPEILMGSNYDFRVDLWSLGVVLYILLVGRYPHDKPTVVQQEFLEDVVSRVECSTTARTILDGLLRLDPTRRYSLDRLKEFKWKGEEARGGRIQAFSDDPPSGRIQSQLSSAQTESLFGSQEWQAPPGAPGPEPSMSGLEPESDARPAVQARQPSVLMPSATSILGLDEDPPGRMSPARTAAAAAAPLNLGVGGASSSSAGRGSSADSGQQPASSGLDRPPLPRRRKKKPDADSENEMGSSKAQPSHPPQDYDDGGQRYQDAHDETSREGRRFSREDTAFRETQEREGRGSSRGRAEDRSRTTGRVVPPPARDEATSKRSSPDVGPTSAVPKHPLPTAVLPPPPRRPQTVRQEDADSSVNAVAAQLVRDNLDLGKEAGTSLSNVHVTENEALVHIVIPERYAGILLGKAGGRMRQVKASSGCNVWMTPRDGNANRMIVVVGEPANNVAAQGHFVDFLSQELAHQGLALQDLTIVMFLPADKVGIVVGKSGSGLQHIHRVSATKVNVLREEMDGKRLCTIVGTFENILVAERLIFEMIGQPLPPASAGKGPVPGLHAATSSQEQSGMPVSLSAAITSATGGKSKAISPITTVPLQSAPGSSSRKRPRQDGPPEAPSAAVPRVVPPPSHPPASSSSAAPPAAHHMPPPARPPPARTSGAPPARSGGAANSSATTAKSGSSSGSQLSFKSAAAAHKKHVLQQKQTQGVYHASSSQADGGAPSAAAVVPPPPPPQNSKAARRSQIKAEEFRGTSAKAGR
mmetsp:Transcript_23401/g.54439  ORF Transcript_23401/g.54439 Transcript_23401/m.54439 type:complete len:961 (+) Transcript_23401:140-3022(+)